MVLLFYGDSICKHLFLPFAWFTDLPFVKFRLSLSRFETLPFCCTRILGCIHRCKCILLSQHNAHEGVLSHGRIVRLIRVLYIRRLKGSPDGFSHVDAPRPSDNLVVAVALHASFAGALCYPLS